jgi:hypothetical protein
MLVFENTAHCRGQVTWAYKYPSAEVFSIAGDYVVWHKKGEEYIQWQVLTRRQPDKTRELEVSRLLKTSGPIKVEDLHVNDCGILHVGMCVEDNPYDVERSFEHLARCW